MNNDQGVLYVVMEHFTRHLHPRALEIEKELDAGHPLSVAQIDHVARVLQDVKWLHPLVERHPEHRELAGRVVALYSSIARRAVQNETARTS